jgi:hypothetical protein
LPHEKEEEIADDAENSMKMLVFFCFLKIVPINLPISKLSLNTIFAVNSRWKLGTTGCPLCHAID